jgi:hypothetical protein
MKYCVALLAVVALCAGSIAPAQAKTGLAPGHWVGTGNNYGSISKQGKSPVTAGAKGHFKMDLYVSKNGVVTGTMAFEGSASSKVKGGTGTFSYGATSYTADGSTADAIVFGGTMDLDGTVTIVTPIHFSAPVHSAVPGTVGMHFKHIDCGSASGDLAEEGRQAQQKAGFTTNVTAPFVLIRVGNAEAKGQGGDDAAASNWFATQIALDNAVQNGFKGMDKQHVEDLISAGENALDEMGKFAECGGKGPLPGYEIDALKTLLVNDIAAAQLHLKTMK